MKMPPMLETVIRPAPESAHMAEWLALVGRRIVFWLLLAATATACASAKAPMGSLFESSDAPIPLRAGYWVQLAFHDARFKGGELGDVSLSDVMESGLVGVARTTFHGSAQFESQAAALASPIVDVVVVPTVGDLTMEPDPEGDRGQADRDSPDAMACVRQGGPGAVVGGGGHPAARVLPGPAVPQAVRGASRERTFRDSRGPDAIGAMVGTRFEVIGCSDGASPRPPTWGDGMDGHTIREDAARSRRPARRSCQSPGPG